MSSRANDSSLNCRQLIDGHLVEPQEIGTLDVVMAIGAMNKSYQLWVKESSQIRAERLIRAIELFRARIESSVPELALLLNSDIGTALPLAHEQSLPTGLALLDRLLSEHRLTDLSKPLLPVGHSALFLGWNDPLVQFCRRVPAIMLAGAGLVVKPSRRASKTVLRLGEFWSQALSDSQVPVGLFSVLTGGHETEDSIGALLLRHPSFKTVFWIGETDTGLLTERIVIESGKRFQMSGSGRNPAVIFAHSDSELDRLADQIMTACLATHTLGPWRPSRLFVQESIYKTMIERIADRMRETRNPSILPERETARFLRQTKQALSETGRLVIGGDLDSEFETACPRPTLIRDLTNCSTLQSQELSGPLLTVASFKYQHEALRYANTSPLGLCGYVVHPEANKALDVLGRLEASVLSDRLDISWKEGLAVEAAPVKDSGRGPQGLSGITLFSSWQGTILPN